MGGRIGEHGTRGLGRVKNKIKWKIRVKLFFQMQSKRRHSEEEDQRKKKKEGRKVQTLGERGCGDSEPAAFDFPFSKAEACGSWSCW